MSGLYEADTQAVQTLSDALSDVLNSSDDFSTRLAAIELCHAHLFMNLLDNTKGKDSHIAVQLHLQLTSQRLRKAINAWQHASEQGEAA